MYILGAGVSYGYVLSPEQISDNALKSQDNIGIYPTTHTPMDGSKRHLTLPKNILSVFDHTIDADFSREKLLLMPESHAHDEYYLAYTTSEYPARCPSYQIFNLAFSSVFLSMNYDGYARHYLEKRHIILQPHGVTHPEIAQYIRENRREYSPFSISIADKFIHPPKSELSTFLIKKEYKYLKSNFNKFENIVIIGYSFGKNDSSIDDEVTFNFILEQADRHQQPIYVIDPQPNFLYTILSRNIHTPILPIDVFWNHFSNACEKAFRDCHRANKKNINFFLKGLLYRYDESQG